MSFRLTSPRGALLAVALFLAAIAHSFSEYQAEAQAGQAAASERRGAPAVSATLQSEFAKAADWRTFALFSMQRPAEGGHFYARHVLEICARESDTLDPLTQRRCTGFAAGEAAHMLAELRLERAASPDPLLQAERALLDAKVEDRRGLQAAVSRVLSLRDPLLLSENELLVRVASSDEEARGRAGLWMDGRLITPESGKTFSQAWLALRVGACKEGSPCALDDAIRLGCRDKAPCAADRLAYVRSKVSGFGGGEDDVATVLALANRIRSAADAGAVSFFMR